MFTVAIVGRPNVGKSRLFNRLVGKAAAIVDETPGLTRDWREDVAHQSGVDFVVLDTAGLETSKDTMTLAMMQQTHAAIDRSNAVFFMIDIREGVTDLDMRFAKEIRRHNKPIVLIANKAENTRQLENALPECYRLGFGEPLPVSAEHNEGMAFLYDALFALIDAHEASDDATTETDDDVIVEDTPSDPLRLCIVGQPNAGKSTLFNRIAGFPRAITSEVAGTTRDTVYLALESQGIPLELFDTAGIRKGKMRYDTIEEMSVTDAYRAIQFAHVAVLVVDATAGLEVQDAKLAHHILEEGRALLIVLNKTDALKEVTLAQATRALSEQLEISLAQLKNVPILPLSALKSPDRDIHALIRKSYDLYTLWNRRIPTSRLNAWLADALADHPPPLYRSKRVRFKYVTQVKTRPPTFSLFSSSPLAEVPESYLRYLSNSLCDAFSYQGVPLRLQVRKQKNPFSKKPRH